MKELPHDLLASHVKSSMEQVFSTMLSQEVTTQPYLTECGSADVYDGVMALVGIAGEWTGTGRLLCSPKLACTLAGSLLMSEYDAVDDEVLDAMAEISNMVVGNVKTILEEELGPLCLSVPTVIFGKNYLTRSVMLRDWLVVPFKCNGESIEFRFCLMPTPANPHAGFRLEMNQV
jgi:chemotaxis protein CheX